MRAFLAMLTLVISTQAFASEAFPMNMKERLRILLWIEGIEQEKQLEGPSKERPTLPEELRRPLENL